MHFDELMRSTGFSVETEIKGIWGLLNTKIDIGRSIYEMLEKNILEFSKRGPYTSLEELMKFIIKFNDTPIESLISLCEMLLEFVSELEARGFEHDVYITSYLYIKGTMYVKNHISGIADRINHKIVYKNNGEIILVPEDKKTIQAAEIISDTNESIAIKILEYKHFSTSVDDKEQILISIAKFMEDKREELSNKLKEDDLYLTKNGKDRLVEQMFEMFNTLHIRHNSNKQYITRRKTQREKWYDYTYNTVLTVIINIEQAKINKEFTELKSKKRS